MNIIIVTGIFPPDIGGPATYTYEVSKRLIERGHQVKIATLTSSARGANIHIISKKRLRFPAFLFAYLVSFIRLFRLANGCELIYTQTPSLLGLASLLVARLRRRPVILRFPGDLAWETAFNSQKTGKFLEGFLRSPEGGTRIRLLLCLQRFVLNRVNRIIVPSQFLKRVLLDYYRVSPKKVTVIYNSINPEDNQMPSTGISRTPGIHRLITVGRLVSHKRVDGLLRTLKGVVEEYPGVTLQIAGDGPERERLQTLAQELDIARKVEFRGQLGHQETMALLREADIFILNSVYEGLPHTVIEAMACRTAVVATNIKGTSEVVKDGETGLLVDVDSDVQLREKITLLLRDKELRERLVAKAYQNVMRNFTWERNLNLLEKELRRVISC